MHCSSALTRATGELAVTQQTLDLDIDLTGELQTLVKQGHLCHIQLYSSFNIAIKEVHPSVKKHIANQICKITRTLADRIEMLEMGDLKLAIEAETLIEAFSYQMSSLTTLLLDGSLNLYPTRELIHTIVDHCPNLEDLDLPNCQAMDDDLLRYTATNLQMLRLLYLHQCYNVTNIGCNYICNHLQNLEGLSLRESLITDAAVERIADLKNLTELYLECCDNISANCINILSNRDSLLETLDIGFCDGIDPNEALGNLGLSHLPLQCIKIGESSGLNHENPDTIGWITDAGIAAFISGEGGKDLVSFTMYRGRSRVTIDALSQLFFKCKKLIVKDGYKDRTAELTPSYITKVINLINY